LKGQRDTSIKWGKIVGVIKEVPPVDLSAAERWAKHHEEFMARKEQAGTPYTGLQALHFFSA
jgi:hypothetical protein